MPQKPRWWLRVPEIVDAVERSPNPWFDRVAIERIFDVKRRRAIELLNAFGGFQAGRTFLIDRDALLRQLRAIRESEDFDWDKKRAAAVSIPVLPSSPALPEGVHFEPGRMIVDFTSVEDLLAKFYAISQTAASDFQAFRDTVDAFTVKR
jgi:hypothetical protein